MLPESAGQALWGRKCPTSSWVSVGWLALLKEPPLLYRVVLASKRMLEAHLPPPHLQDRLAHQGPAGHGRAPWPCGALVTHPSPELTGPWGHLTSWPVQIPFPGIGPWSCLCGWFEPGNRLVVMSGQERWKTTERLEIKDEVASKRQRGAKGGCPIPGHRAKEVGAPTLGPRILRVSLQTPEGWPGELSLQPPFTGGPRGLETPSRFLGEQRPHGCVVKTLPSKCR